MAKSCQTGHATNIIQGFAVGYESTVGRPSYRDRDLSVGRHLLGASPIFVAYGVAMCGIGMLTLTGNTIAWTCSGLSLTTPTASAKWATTKEMGEEKYKEARQILADLDAVGNTTKAETKGIAIGCRRDRRRQRSLPVSSPSLPWAARSESAR